MKPKILFKICLSILIAFFSFDNIKAQSGYGEVRGKITVSEEKDEESIFNTQVILCYPDGSKVKMVFPDYGGNYFIKSINPGEYFLKVILKDYDTTQTPIFEVNVDKISFYDVPLAKPKKLDNANPDKVTELKAVVIKPKSALGKEDNGAPPISGERVQNGGTRDITRLITGITAGVNQAANGSISFVGSRTDGTAIFVDGVRVNSSSAVNTQSIGQVNVIIGGVPAQYGDFTGGAIAYTTKGITNTHSKSIEFLSSSPFNPYHNNRLEFFANGPLYIKNKGADQNDTTKPERTVLGYLFSFTAAYDKDRTPSYVGYYNLNKDKLDEIEKNPLVPAENGFGYVHAGNYVTEADIENVRARPNAHHFITTTQGKIDWAPNKNSLVTFYGSYRYQDFLNAGRSVFNYNNNARVINQDILTYVRFRQDLPNPSNDAQFKKTTLSKAWYNVRIDFQQTNQVVMDQVHKSNVFDYGYIGTFTNFEAERFNYVNNNNNPFAATRTFVDQNGDTVKLREFHEQTGFLDTALRFKASDLNPIRAAYTSNLYDDFERQGRNITNASAILGNQGLLNGLNPPNIYGLWAAPGQVASNYNKVNNQFFSIFAMGEASLTGPLEKDLNRKPHDLQFGLFFEQSSFNNYGLNANGLWFLMPQLMNTHNNTLDRNNPILSYNSDGVFTDTIRYNKLILDGQQTNFDKNLRNSLINSGAKDVYGNPINESSAINVNSLTPEQFQLKMFNANELLNNGNSYVSYNGFDHLGNRVRGKSSINDFLLDQNRRAINGYNPIFTAAWIQDKFDFKDLIFRVGLRVERFDANQLVLKDPYSLYPVKTVGEVKDLNGVPQNHPDAVGNDYKVYVNNVNNPTKILGYRDGDQWYDNAGRAITNPELIANQTDNGKISPYLVDPNEQNLSSNSFEDYKPQVNILPRVWFSFPINTTALFFANYDVLAQRPQRGQSFATIDDYFYMEARSGQTLANPALTPRLKTNYEIGFRQVLQEQSYGKGVGAILGITASYSEIRNDINEFFFNQAYPISYISFSNIDFSTIKSFRSDIQLKYDKMLSLTANYSLLFANGTGANASSARALIQSNQPNLRSLFPLADLDIRHAVKANLNYEFGGGKNDRTGKDEYYGPANLRKYLEYASVGLIYTATSGIPYTALLQPLQIGSTDRSPIKGDPFGSRLPWNNNFDIQVSKGWAMKYAKGQKQGLLVGFLIVSNVLNTRNVVGVWPYSGQTDDDGFLSSPRGQQALASQINAASFSALYRIITDNPGFYRAPRFAQLGVRFQF